MTNYVGNIVFNNDTRKADEVYGKFQSGTLDFPKNRDRVLYIETDGAMLNTRTKSADNSTWRENKLGEVFSSDNIRYWTDKHGKKQHQLLKREYVSYIGNVHEFKKYLLSCALKCGYGKYKHTVLISDGATWIRNLTLIPNFFPTTTSYLHNRQNIF